MLNRVVSLCLGGVLAFLITSGMYATSPLLTTIETQWDTVLTDTVISGQRNGYFVHLVDYDKVKTHPEYTALLASLKQFDLATLTTREEKLSFWINAYNIAVVKTVVDYNPHYSIRDVGNVFRSVWKLDVLPIGNQVFNAYDIENKILHEMDEPRIHFALSCAALSCPNLNRNAYSAQTIEQELERQTLSFLSDTTKGLRLSSNETSVSVSKLFTWFEEDFKKVGGIKVFLNRYTGRDMQDMFVTYLTFDWGLNRYVEI